MLPVNPNQISPSKFIVAPVVCSLTGATDPATGVVALSLKSPNNYGVAPVTYGSLNPTGQGRFLDNSQIWFGNPAAGDKILGMYVKDVDGVMDVADRSQFPNYPIITSMIDPMVTAGSQGLYMNQYQITALENFGYQVFVPAGLYLILVAKTVTPRADNLFVNLRWLVQIPPVYTNPVVYESNPGVVAE
jgi:hypothetical protein